MIASFGGVEFDCIVVSDRFSREVERNRYRGRDGGDLRDRGADFRETDCEVIFFDRAPIAGEGPDSALSYRQRWHLFYAAWARGRAQDFVHPTEGGYLAVIEDLDKVENAEEPDVIRAHCRFVEDSTQPSPLVTGAARPRTAGIADAQLEVDATRDAIDELNLDDAPDTSFLDDAEAYLSKWRDPDLSQDIAKELGQATRAIETAQRTLGLATDPESYSAFVATERLAAALRSAAETVRQSQPQLRRYVVARAQPLRRLCVTLYGGEQALARYDEILSLNTIDDPGFLAVGLELLVPVDDVQRRSSLRAASA